MGDSSIYPTMPQQQNYGQYNQGGYQNQYQPPPQYQNQGNQWGNQWGSPNNFNNNNQPNRPNNYPNNNNQFGYQGNNNPYQQGPRYF